AVALGRERDALHGSDGAMVDDLQLVDGEERRGHGNALATSSSPRRRGPMRTASRMYARPVVIGSRLRGNDGSACNMTCISATRGGGTATGESRSGCGARCR